MDSAALTTYVTVEWAEVLAETSIDPAYVVSAVEAVYAADTTLADAYAEPLADYYLLRRAVRYAATQFDMNTEGDSLSLGKRVDRWKSWLDEAAARVSGIVDAGASRRGRVVTISADYLTGESTA